MPLTDETKSEISKYLTKQLARYIADQKAKGNALDVQPFHARLLPDLFKIPLSERSFSTRSGGWFQQMAKSVARQFHPVVEQPYTLHGNIQPGASAHIETMLGQMDKGVPKRRPSRLNDIASVLGVQSTGGASLSVTADLFIRTYAAEEWYFEMKTAQPNKGQCKEMKRFILQVAALRHQEHGQAFASTAYNALGDGKPVIDGKIRQFLEPGADILIGRDFWSKIGDMSTYDELLLISEEVGKQLAPQIS
ncbi:MAG: TdeIII family type II restriction endonuclease [Edaphobacter sp.]